MRCFICAQIVIATVGLFVRLGMAIRKRALGFPLGALLFLRGFHSLGRFFSEATQIRHQAFVIDKPGPPFRVLLEFQLDALHGRAKIIPFVWNA